MKDITSEVAACQPDFPVYLPPADISDYSSAVTASDYLLIRNTLRKGLVFVGIVVGGVLSLNEFETEQHPEAIIQYDHRELPAGACNSTTLEAREPVVQSVPYASSATVRECVSAYSGRYALIDFGVNNVDAEAVAADTEKLIRRTSNGLLQPQIDVIAASPDVMHNYEVMTEDGCAPNGSAEFSTVHMAAQLMPQTDEYDILVGLHDAPLCSGAAGVAYVDNGRLADAAMTPSITVPDRDYEAVNITHEIQHLLRLGHGGRARSMNFATQRQYGLESLAYGREAQLDLDQYMQAGIRYTEYGDSSTVMGYIDGAEAESFGVQPFHQAVLEAPIRASIGRSSAIADIDTAPAVFDTSTIVDQLVASVALPASYNLDDARFQERSFDRLVLVPQVDDRQGQEAIIGVQLLLTDSRANYAELGVVYAKQLPDRSLTIQTGGKQVQLAWNENGSLWMATA